ncbi:hypothetical protein WMF30_32870 [Sorangium sp. So ce134]
MVTVAVVMVAVVMMAVMMVTMMMVTVMVVAVMMVTMMTVTVVRLAAVHRLGGNGGRHLLDQREILDGRGGVSRGELRASDHRRGRREDGDQFYMLHRRLLLHGAPDRGATEPGDASGTPLWPEHWVTAALSPSG